MATRNSRKKAQQAPPPVAEELTPVAPKPSKGKGRGKKSKTATPVTPATPEPTDRQLLLELTRAFKEQQVEVRGLGERLGRVEDGGAPPATPPSPSTSKAKPAKKRKTLVSPSAQPGAKVRKQMAPRVVEFAPVQTSGSDETSSSDSDDYHQDNTPTPVKITEAAATAPRKRKLKSGRVRTANSHVKALTTWPHDRWCMTK
jgi:hypothetical protein